MSRYLLFILLCITSVAFALTPDDCLFYASFDDGLDAVQAKGARNAAVTGQFAREPGIRGQAVVVGAPDTRLAYQTRDNIRLDAGTLSMWIKPLTWSDDDPFMRVFFCLNDSGAPTQQDGGTFCWLYHFWRNTDYFLVWDTRPISIVTAPDPKLVGHVLQQGQWTHLVGSWNGDDMRFYVNGQWQSTLRMPNPRLLRSMASEFTLGEFNRANAADTALDEVRIFNRALTAPEVEALYHFSLQAEPAQEQEVTATPLTSARQVRVEVTAPAASPSTAAEYSARVSLQHVGQHTVLQTATATFTDLPHVSVDFSTAKLAPGNYRAVSTLLYKGQEVAVQEAPFTVHAPPAWLGSKIGITDDNTVPAPWTPLKADRRAKMLECWGPRRVGAGLLPTALSTAGHEMLASPMTLSGTVNGYHLKTADPKLTWGQTAPAKAIYTATARTGEVLVSTRNVLEFDGLLWITLTVRSTGPLRVDNLMLDLPLRADIATLMQVPNNFRETGFVHPWHGRVGAGTQIWLGNEDGGVQCTIPTAKNWLNIDRAKQLQILPDTNGCVTLRLNLVDKPSTFSEPITYEFGLQLTPVRPHPKGWRMWRIANPDLVKQGTLFSLFYTEGWAKGTSYPIPGPGWEQRINANAAKGSPATLYFQPYSIWSGIPDYAQFASEWRLTTRGVPPPADPNANPISFMSLCPRAHSWSDWFVSTFVETMATTNKNLLWGSTYFDNVSPNACDNTAHGCGYRDEYGVMQQEIPFQDYRIVQKRFYTAMQQRYPDRLMFNHSSGFSNMTQLAFTHGMIDGENIGGPLLLQEKCSYANILTLDRMRAEYMGHNFGFVPIFLTEFNSASGGDMELGRYFVQTEPTEVMHVVGLLMLHDILPWSAYCNSEPFYRWWAVQDAFGWGDEVEWQPYWKNRDFVTLEPSDSNIVCTLYRRSGKVLVVVMNNTDIDREITVQLNFQKLGMKAPATALDAWKATSCDYVDVYCDAKGILQAAPKPGHTSGVEERLPITNGHITLPVSKRNFRLLLLE
jgi:hypothetical protein